MNVHRTYTLASRPETARAQRRAGASRGLFGAALLLADIFTILSMACVTGVGYHALAYHEAGDVAGFLQVGIIAASIFVIPNLYAAEYRLASFYRLRPQVRRAFQLWNVTFVCLLALGFFAKTSGIYSRGWIALFYVATIPILLGMRILFVQIAVRGSRTGWISAQNVFLLGTGQQIGDFVRRYEPWKLGINVIGCRFLTPQAQTVPAAMRMRTLQADLAQAVDSARNLKPDAVFLILPWSESAAINASVEAFSTLPIEIHLGPEPILDKFDGARLSKLGPLASLQLARVPLSRVEIIQKRLFDIVFASLALLALTPFLLAIAALIKLDSKGPVFFLQRRYGFNQQQFRIIKFRTMITQDDGAIVRQARRNDARVTRVGRILRRWSIDEVPQLLNVILGDMSLVGPRPHALSHNREFQQRIALYARRHNVKPGITGWAQIHGFRGETDVDEKMRKRVEFDLFYIDNWSMWLDLQIVVRTLISPSVYRNAY